MQGWIYNYLKGVALKKRDSGLVMTELLISYMSYN